jgi:hypothetical protein
MDEIDEAYARMMRKLDEAIGYEGQGHRHSLKAVATRAAGPTTTVAGITGRPIGPAFEQPLFKSCPHCGAMPYTLEAERLHGNVYGFTGRVVCARCKQ